MVSCPPSGITKRVDFSPRHGASPGLAAALCLAALAGCASAQEAPFSHAPIDLDRVREIVPLGNLNPPGHTFPTDHVYLYLDDPRRPAGVVAPAAGRIERIHAFEPHDAKIVVRVSDDVSYYLGHVDPARGLEAGDAVAAGDLLGTTSGVSYALDLGVVDRRVRRSFVRPERYPEDTIHAASPFPRFDGPVRDRLLSLVRRTGPDKDGRIEFDRPGRLAGNWFLEELPRSDRSASPESWSGHLSFVRDVHDPDSIRIAIGGTIGPPGVFAVEPGSPDPAGIDPAAGRVVYRLVDPHERRPRGTLEVEMLDEETIRVRLEGEPARTYRR